MDIDSKELGDASSKISINTSKRTKRNHNFKIPLFTIKIIVKIKIRQSLKQKYIETKARPQGEKKNILSKVYNQIGNETKHSKC